MPEFNVVTECGRNFVIEAYDLDKLFRHITDRGYRAKLVREWHEPPRNIKQRGDAI